MTSTVLDWRLLPQSNVFITNQSYTKVHPSAEYPAYQMQFFYVDKGARLEYKPEPIMLYKGASFRADTEIKLEAGAVVFVTEVVCPGRVLRDEVFQYVRYDSRLQVYYENQLIYHNRQNIEPDSQENRFPTPCRAGKAIRIKVRFIFFRIGSNQST